MYIAKVLISMWTPSSKWLDLGYAFVFLLLSLMGNASSPIIWYTKSLIRENEPNPKGGGGGGQTVKSTPLPPLK